MRAAGVYVESIAIILIGMLVIAAWQRSGLVSRFKKVAINPA